MSQFIVLFNFFLSSLSHLLQIIEKVDGLSKRYDVLGFLNFLYLSQKIQFIFFILTFLESIENVLVLFSHFFHIG